jgi:vacuolar-type H+-ATPase subunit I/STV1
MNENLIEEITKLVLLKLEEHAEALPFNKKENNITSFKTWGTEFQPNAASPQPLTNEEIKRWINISGSLQGGKSETVSFNKATATRSLDAEELKKWEDVATLIRKTATQNVDNTEEQVKLYPTFY